MLAQPTTLTTTMRQRDVDENAEGIILYYAKALSMQGYGRCSLGCGLQSHGLESSAAVGVAAPRAKPEWWGQSRAGRSDAVFLLGCGQTTMR